MFRQQRLAGVAHLALHALVLDDEFRCVRFFTVLVKLLPGAEYSRTSRGVAGEELAHHVLVFDVLVHLMLGETLEGARLVDTAQPLPGGSSAVDLVTMVNQLL